MVCIRGLVPAGPALGTSELASSTVLKSKGVASTLRLLLPAHNTSYNDELPLDLAYSHSTEQCQNVSAQLSKYSAFTPEDMIQLPLNPQRSRYKIS